MAGGDDLERRSAASTDRERLHGEEGSQESVASLLAGVIFVPDDPVDTIIKDAVAAARRRGLVVGGCIQHHDPEASGCAAMAVEDIGTGRVTGIAQNLGSGAAACRLDTRALAEVAVRLEAIAAGDIDALVLNRFGKAEIEGGGLRDVIAIAVGRGVPVLVPVMAPYDAAWREFGGELAEVLSPTAEAVAAWLGAIPRQASRTVAAE